MRKCHPKNERIKRHYFAYLEEAKRMNSSSVDQAAAAIANFENTTGHRDFAAFHTEQARKFKRHLAEEINSTTGKPLAKATTYSRLMAVKSFLVWLAGHPDIGHALPTPTWSISTLRTTTVVLPRRRTRSRCQL
jgi:site-specific recombinase XerD